MVSKVKLFMGDPLMPPHQGVKYQSSSNTVGETLGALQNVIERNVNELSTLKDQLKSFKESVRNILTNDETLSDIEDQATAVQQKVKERKAQLQVSPEILQIKANITEISERKKEIEEALNSHFLQLFQLTGSKTYDTSAGETREFTIKATVKSQKEG